VRAALRRVWAPALLGALLAGAVLAPLAAAWFAGQTVVWFDTARLYAPERWIVDEALRALRLPLWNPFVAAGMPLHADAIHGVLHPVSILAAALGTSRSADVLVGGHVACAAVGAAWLARELGASRGAAAVAAVAYGCSGFVLSMAGNLVFLAGAGSLPFCVAGLRRFAVAPGAGSLALGAAGAAGLALTGDIQAVIVAGAVALVLAWEGAGPGGAARAVAGGVAGLLAAGAQLVPSAYHFLQSDRAAASWSTSPAVWALEPWRVPELVLPGLLWGPDPLMDRVYGALAGAGHWMADGLPNPFAASLFVGLVPVALAVCGAGAGRRGKVLAITAAALLWIALGPALGASAALSRVPLWGAFRYPEKLVGPLTLVVALLGALGADAVAAGKVRGRRLAAAAGGLALAGILACRLELARLPHGLAPEAAARVDRGTWHVLSAAVALLVWLVARRRLGPRAGAPALAVVTWASLVAASGAALRPGDPGARLAAPGPSLAASAPGPRLVTPYDYEPDEKAPEADWIDVAAREHAAKGYAAYNVRARLDSIDDYAAMLPGRLARVKAAFGARWPEAARRYAVTHVVADPPRSEPHRMLHALATGGGVRVEAAGAPAPIWSVPHREWASFAPEVQVVAGEDAALAETARAFAEGSPRVVIEAFGRFAAAPGRVLAVQRGLESLRVEADAGADGTLVVADAWWPGWEATLDGARVPVFRADALVRAVRWPAGRHVLEMRYRPPEVGTGLAVSAAGLGAVALWAAALRRRARRRGADRAG
jgi:hypothetical protein